MISPNTIIVLVLLGLLIAGVVASQSWGLAGSMLVMGLILRMVFRK